MKPIAEMSFEEALESLNKLLEEMEQAQLPLDDAVAAYERSAALRKHCQEKLKTAQMRVEKVLQNDERNVERFDEG